MGKGFRDATARKKFANARSGMKAWAEILSGIGLQSPRSQFMKAAMRSQRGWLPAFGPRSACGPSTLHPVSRTKLDASNRPGRRGPGCPHMVGARFSCWFIIALNGNGRLVGPSLMTAIVLRDLVRLSRIDSASAVLTSALPTRRTSSQSPGSPLGHWRRFSASSLQRLPFSSVDTSGCPDHRPCERSRRRSRSFGLVISCWFRSRRDAASHTAL